MWTQKFSRLPAIWPPPQVELDQWPLQCYSRTVVNLPLNLSNQTDRINYGPYNMVRIMAIKLHSFWPFHCVTYCFNKLNTLIHGDIACQINHRCSEAIGTVSRNTVKNAKFSNFSLVRHTQILSRSPSRRHCPWIPKRPLRIAKRTVLVDQRRYFGNNLFTGEKVGWCKKPVLNHFSKFLVW